MVPGSRMRAACVLVAVGAGLLRAGEEPADPAGVGAAGADGVAVPAAEAVDAAVARGVVWLRKEQKGNGAFGSSPGETALALMALRHSGVPSADKACTKAARSLERALPDGTVYGAALGTLALLEQDASAHRGEIEKLVKALAGGQCRNGQWTYAYRSTARKSGGDNSNSQLAVLALAAARTRRVDVPPEAFARIAAYLAAHQNDDGGFGYSDKQRARSYGSMTAGGAMMLALAAGRDAPGVAKALAWLAEDFDPTANRDAGRAFGNKRGNRGDTFWKHYWLWSVERACSAAGVDALGAHDWYALGARHLLESQRDDGAWRDPEGELQASCFALLFLTRSTRRALTPRPGDAVVTPGSGG